METTGIRPSAVIAQYPLTVTSRQVLQMPQGAALLTVYVQQGQLMLWALVNPAAPITTRAIAVVETGAVVPAVSLDIYIGAGHEDRMSWHVFDLGEN